MSGGGAGSGRIERSEQVERPERPEPPGRRERKKAATRQAIADAALALFLERGYDQVSIREIADAADVSTTTLFKHFSGKEALVFDEDAQIEARLVAAVRDREAGTSIPQALRALTLERLKFPTEDEAFAAYTRLVESTPVLREYWHRMWMRHEGALAAAIAAEVGAAPDDAASAVLAHFALETASLARASKDPKGTVDVAFAVLESGWAGVEAGSGSGVGVGVGAGG
ncbi:AcrR family transcriptional regulator [Catenulispora sp. GAS73]|uniref:TetR/AcrR family transcriptional regulator n=1 Tax=Catenulispora sp. GAS73 TaxID=3156269 RepID=UPI003514CB9A